MRHLAIDIGATGGKVYVGTADGSSLSFGEVHRFENRPIERHGRWVWNVERLLEGIGKGIEKADEEGGIESIGVDSMGVDFGLFEDGELIQEPYSYRDPTVSSTRDEMLESASKREVFEATGINHWNAKNSLWQYHYLANNEREAFERADTMVNMPQVVSTLLGGRSCAEVTVASTTQMLDPRTYTWATDLLDRLGLPTGPLPPIERPGTRIGELDPRIATDVSSMPDIVLPASHDTAAAVAAMPFSEDDRAFLSTGTVFIMGVEVDEPIVSDAAFEIGASNEVGVDGTIRFLKNLNNGFFLLEECRHSWKEHGEEHGYDPLMSSAEDASPFRSLIDPDAKLFETVGEMPEKIRSYCAQTDQPVPDGKGEMTRCILEGLTLKTALILEDVFEVTGTSSDVLHLGGGGVRNELFCEMVAAATGQTVVAGPSDAAAVGNILVQASAYDRIDSIREGRRLVERELNLTRYGPHDTEGWEAAKNRLQQLESADVRELV